MPRPPRDRGRIGGVLQVAILAGIATASCAGDDAACAGVRDAGLVIAVVDDDTGDAICDASVRLTQGTYTEDLAAEPPDPCRYIGARRPGSYSVAVTADGYAPTTVTTTVEARDDGGCGSVETREIELRLTPTPRSEEDG